MVTEFLQKEFKFNEKFIDSLTVFCLFCWQERLRDWAKMSMWTSYLIPLSSSSFASKAGITILTVPWLLLRALHEHVVQRAQQSRGPVVRAPWSRACCHHSLELAIPSVVPRRAASAWPEILLEMQALTSNPRSIRSEPTLYRFPGDWNKHYSLRSSG